MSSHLAIRDLPMIQVFQSFKCSLALHIISTCFLMDSNSSTSFTIHICCWTRHDLDRETPASLGIIQTLWMEHRTNWSAKWHQPYLFLLSDGLGPLNGSIHSMKLHLLDLLWVYFVDLHLCTVTSASPNKNGGEDTVSEIHYKRTYVVICSINLYTSGYK